MLTKCQAAEAVDHLQVSDAGRFSCNLLGWMVPGARVRGGEVTLTALHLSIPRLPITFPFVPYNAYHQTFILHPAVGM